MLDTYAENRVVHHRPITVSQLCALYFNIYRLTASTLRPILVLSYV
jgi:hypothetical protein